MDWEYFIQGLFIEWSKEYNMPKKRITFGGFADLEDGTMGICRHQRDENGPLAVAYLSKHWLTFDRMPELLLRAVAWHEYCHGECWVDDGVANNHDEIWAGKRARKPVYHYADYVAKFMWGIWKMVKHW